MPLFEYKCNNCSKIIEKVQLKAKKSIKCPYCNYKAQKILSIFLSRHSSDSIRSKKMR